MMNPSLQVAGKTSDACTLQSIEAEKRLFVATYHGDNMKPKISDGDVIYFCPQDDLDLIMYGHVFYVETDDFSVVCHVRRYAPDEDNKVILHHANPEYQDMILDKSKIRSCYMADRIVSVSIKQSF